MHVAVVGGGIVGLASAYYLADRGVEVTVLEKGSLGGGATGRANGGIRAQFTSPVSVELSRESVAVWESFEDEFGAGINFRQTGYLFLARTPETAERFRENVRVQNDLGVDSEFLAPEAAAERCPGLHAEQFVGATYCATDGLADPHRAVGGFATAAAAADVELRTGTEVVDVLTDDSAGRTGDRVAGADRAGRRNGGAGGERVVGVETDDGRVEADYVVNAAGAWGGRIAAMAGLDLPITPKRRQLAVVDPDRPVPASAPFTADLDGGGNFRPEREGRAVVGGYFSESDPAADPDDYRESGDLEWAAAAIDGAAAISDHFGPDTEVVRGWAGLLAFTPDDHPVIEETIPGFVNAVGFSGHGFMQAPAVGQVVAELVVEGESRTVDVSALTAGRFERGELLEEGTVLD